MTSELFDRLRRKAIRARALRLKPREINLSARNADDMVERLSWVRKTFANALIIGDRDNAIASELDAQNVKAVQFDLFSGQDSQVITGEEDHLPFAQQSFDLIIANGTLDSVNDLPGALLLIRRCLTPGGLFLGAMSGAGSLAGLRTLFAEAIAIGEIPGRQHIHPQIDIRSAGDLLVRAGFALPVVDQDEAVVAFPRFDALIHDLRANGLTNALHGIHPFTRRDYDVMRRNFEAGPMTESFNTIFLTGWTAQAGDPKAQVGPTGKAPISIQSL